MNSLRSNSISYFVAQIADAIRDSISIQRICIPLKTSSCGMFLGLLSFSLQSFLWKIVRKTLEAKTLENILGCAKRFAIIARCYMFLANVRKHSARGGIYRMYYYRNLLRFLYRESETSKSTWDAVWAERVHRMITIILHPASELRTFSHLSLFRFFRWRKKWKTSA